VPLFSLSARPAALCVSCLAWLSLAGCGALNSLQSPSSAESAQNPTRSVAPGVLQPGATRLASDTSEPAAVSGITAAHNGWRIRLELPPLLWSARLAQTAQQRADQLQAQQQCAVPDTRVAGENVAAASGWTADTVVNSWGDEMAFYQELGRACLPGHRCDHYTQLVWRASRQLGCGLAHCGTTAVWVCHCDPPGNQPGERPY